MYWSWHSETEGRPGRSIGELNPVDRSGTDKIDRRNTDVALVSTLVLVGLMADGNAIVWGVAVGISAMATALEQVSPAGVDNLSVPLLVSLCWVLLIS